MNILTLEGNILVSSFGAPKTFRVPSNTTCYVCLNIKSELYPGISHVFS